MYTLTWEILDSHARDRGLHSDIQLKHSSYIKNKDDEVTHVNITLLDWIVWLKMYVYIYRKYNPLTDTLPAKNIC